MRRFMLKHEPRWWMACAVLAGLSVLAFYACAPGPTAPPTQISINNNNNNGNNGGGPGSGTCKAAGLVGIVARDADGTVSEFKTGREYSVSGEIENPEGCAVSWAGTVGQCSVTGPVTTLSTTIRAKTTAGACSVNVTVGGQASGARSFSVVP